MRMSAEMYQSVKSAMVRVVELAGGIDVVNSHYANKTRTYKLWEVLHAGMTRVASPFGYADLYKDGLNDSHIETAIKRIGTELGL